MYFQNLAYLTFFIKTAHKIFMVDCKPWLKDAFYFSLLLKPCDRSRSPARISCCWWSYNKDIRDRRLRSISLYCRLRDGSLKKFAGEYILYVIMDLNKKMLRRYSLMNMIYLIPRAIVLCYQFSYNDCGVGLIDLKLWLQKTIKWIGGIAEWYLSWAVIDITCCCR